jgi:hypothetical protein
VRTLVLSANSADVHAEFSGEVRARIESRLAFRVGGKVTGARSTSARRSGAARC